MSKSCAVFSAYPSGCHGASASATSAADWYRSFVRLAIILATTSDRAVGTRPFNFLDSGSGSFVWCWASFWTVVPWNGGWPVTSA